MQSVSQTIDQVDAIKTHTGSSKSELFSGTLGHFKVWKSLAVRTEVGENILDVRILEKMANHFLRNLYKRPGILSDGVIIRTNPVTSG